LPQGRESIGLEMYIFYLFFHQHFHYAFSQWGAHLMAKWKSTKTVAGKSFAPEVGIQMKKL